MNRSLSLSLVLLSTSSASIVLAGQDVPKAEEVTVTVSAEAIPVSTAAASVTVVGRETIEMSGAEDVTGLLRTLPGLNVVQTGGRGGLTAVTLRGAEASFTLVMIDGVPVNDITNQLGGAYDFSNLSTDNIERIEIVRGPLSSLYGSEATGGVINIISRRGDGATRIGLEASLGNFGSRRFAFSSAGKKESFDFSVAASYFSIDEQTEGDTLELGTISAQSGVALGADKLLRFQARFSDSSTTGFPENGGGPRYSLLREVKRTDGREWVLGSVFEHELRDYWLYSLQLDYFARNQGSFTPSILDAIPPTERSQPSVAGDSRFSRLRFGYLNSWKLPKRNWSANALLRVRRESGISDLILADVLPSSFDLERTTTAVGGELLYRDRRLTASLGLRLDKSGGFEAEFSPRVGVNVLLSDWGLRLKSSWGEGFKLPSFFALAEPNVGNPDLQPETSRGFDLGLELTRERFSGSVMYFYSRFRDLIDFSPTQFRLVNRNAVISQGLELELRFRPSRAWEFSGHSRYLNLENVDSDEPLRDRPKWRGGVALQWEPKNRTYIRLENLWVGQRYDFQLPVPDQTVVGGYSTANLVIRQRLTSRFEIFSRIDNLLDHQYEEFIGFPNPGLCWRIGLRFNPIG